jgi:uncharacterized protein
MTADVLRATFELFADWALRFGRGRLAFIWHGGEPLLMPLSFWDEVFAGQAEIFTSRGITVENRIQSNLTRLSPGDLGAEDLAPGDLALQYLTVVKRLVGERGTVGTSSDPLPGIREIKGAPYGLYQEKWHHALDLLSEAGVRYGILYVVHRHSLAHLPEVYRHFRDRHPAAGLRFNPLYRQGRASEDRVWTDLGITAQEWGEALKILYEAWTRDGRPQKVQPFGPWWQLHAEGKWRLSCECSGRCVSSHFGVDPEGGVYLCGRSADGANFRFGAAADLTAEALYDHPLRRSLANRMVYLKRTFCRDCRYWLYCHGGCVNDSLLGTGTPFAPTSLCAGLKEFFEHAFGPARKESSEWAA